MTIKTSAQRADLTALLDSFSELSDKQQDIVVDYCIQRGLDVDRRGGMYARDYLLMIAADLKDQHRQAFFDVVGRVSLTAWEPDTAQ